MAKIPVKKLRDDDGNYFPVSVLDSVFLNKEIQVKNTIGGVTKGYTFQINTSLQSILTKLFTEEGADISALLLLKVDKEEGKALSSNDFTNDHKTLLESIPTSLEGKVDKETNKRLITNVEGEKLANLENYDDTEVRGLIDDKVSKDGDKVLTDVNFSQSDKDKLDTLQNYNDTEVRNLISGKVDGSCGESLIFNESDGGGIKYTSASTGITSAIAINDPAIEEARGLAGQLYVVNGTRKTKINMYDGKICYVKGVNPANDAAKAKRELVVKEDLSPEMVLSAIQDMDDIQIAALKTKLGI